MERTNKDKEMEHSSKITAICKTGLSACAAMITFAVVLSLTSCVKDELHNTPYPDKGAIVVQMDWNDLLPEAISDTYILNVDGYEQTASGTTNSVERLSEPGEHSLMVYNRPDGITISGDIASVDEDTAPANHRTGVRAADGSTSTDATVTCKPLPGYLFSLSRTVNVEKDDTLRITAKPRQWVRQTNIRFIVSEGNYSRIASVTGTLSGVERSVNLRTGERTGTVVRVGNGFTVTGNECDTGFRLMGIVSTERQVLTVNITFTNGDTQTIESDLTEQMQTFNDGNTPLTLTGNLSLPVEGEIGGSIEDWQQADGGNTDAH